MRLRGRCIPREAIIEAVASYEIIESYPADKYLPSYLVLARWGGNSLHILFATDVADKNARIVTAYRPSRDEWQDDMKTRRAPR